MNALVLVFILLTPPQTPASTIADFKARKTKTLASKKAAGVVMQMKYPDAWSNDTYGLDEPFLFRQPIIAGQWHSQCYTGMYGEATCSLLVRFGRNINNARPPSGEVKIKKYLSGRSAGLKPEGSVDDSVKFIDIRGQKALLYEYTGRVGPGDRYLSAVFLSFVRNGKVVDVVMWTEGPGVRWNAVKKVAKEIRPLFTLMLNSIRFP